MKRVAFAILAGISLVLLIAAAVAWPLSYWKPRTLNVATRNGDPAVGESPAEVTAKAFIENRSGRIVWLSQWVHLEERKRGAWVISADCSLPRMLLVFADDGTGLPAFANMRIADTVVEPAYTSAGTQQPDTVWRRAGFGLDWRQPIPESAEARDRAASMPARSGGLNTGVPRNLGVLPMDYAGYRQLMIPSWLPVLLGLPLPLLWLRTNRRSVRWAREGRCPGCGYDLRATPSAAPNAAGPARIRSRKVWPGL